MAADHHTAYLAKAISGLTPEGRRRVDELLAELAAAAGTHERVARFARDRAAEVESGHAEPRRALEPSSEELDRLTTGFLTIRDEEPLDDVSDWANAVLSLIADERGRRD